MSVDFAIKFKKDFDFGIAEEEKKLELMRSKFGDDVERTSKGCVFDYHSSTVWAELKTRNCFKDTYVDTMVGKNKLDFAERSCRDCFFVFSFKDGIYYWKYNKEDIASGKVTFKKGGRFDRGKPEVKDYAYIHKDLLIKI